MLSYHLKLLQGKREGLLGECGHAFKEFKIKGNMWYGKTYEERLKDFIEVEAEIKIVERLIENE